MLFRILHSVERYFLTAVSEHPNGPTFKGPAVLLVPKRCKGTTDLRHVKSLKSAGLKVLEMSFGS